MNQLENSKEMDISLEQTCFLCKSICFNWSSQINRDKIRLQKITLCKTFSISPYTLDYVNLIGNEDTSFCYPCSEKIARLDTINKEHEERLKPIRADICSQFVLNDDNPDDRLFKEEVRRINRSLKKSPSSSSILCNGTSPVGSSSNTASPSTKKGNFETSPPEATQFQIKPDDIEAIISNFERNQETKSSLEQIRLKKLAQKKSNNFKAKKLGRPFNKMPTDQDQDLDQDQEMDEYSTKKYNDNQGGKGKVSKSQSTPTPLSLPSPIAAPTQVLKINTSSSTSNFNAQNQRSEKSPAIRTRSLSGHHQPAWLTEVIPEKSPYVPQLDDELIYFRQGHEKYVTSVLQQNLYKMDDEFVKHLPYNEDTNLSAEIRVKIVKIEYLILPPQIVSLDLAVLSWGKGTANGQIINVKYHVIPSMCDFLILNQLYREAMLRKWVVGDRFRYYVFNQWHVGEVVSKRPLDKKFPDSNFLCYLTKYWKSSVVGDEEELSPWDMERIEPEFETVIQQYLPEHGIPTFPLSKLDRQQRKDFYKVNFLDWPSSDQDAECKRISAMLTKVMYLPIAKAFRHPVCSTKYPNYAIKVPYPIDISTIKSRLENLFYRRLSSLQNDIQHISKNAEKFNDPQAEIISYAKIIRDICLKITTDKELVNLNMLYDKLLRDYNITDESCALTTSDLTFSTSLGSERSSGQIKAWNEKCFDLLEDLFSSEDSFYFRYPVDPEKIPEYYEVIKNPIDLTFIRYEYDWGKYDSPAEFAKDLRLIFSNSRTFNTNKKSQIYEITTRFKAMYQDRIKDIVDEWSRSTKRKRKHSENGSSRSSMA